jgi:serine/threonine protein kinase
MTKTVYNLINFLQALAFMHRHNVAHLDLKESNLMIRDDRLQIIDFGLALYFNNSPYPQGRGTSDFMAPEMRDGTGERGEPDVWSAGIIVQNWVLKTFAYFFQFLLSVLKSAIYSMKRISYLSV